MNNKYPIILILLTVLTVMTSCLSSDDESSFIYYDDAAVTSFSLGSLKREMTTKSSTGADSTYNVTVDGTAYPFCIDQAKGLIYNLDSLPENTNTKKCLVTVNTRNSGVAFIKSLTSDSIFVITTTDSLDFSVPRTVRIQSHDGSWTKDYTVEVRVHKEKADQLYWTKKNSSSAIGSLNGMKAFCMNNTLIAYGTAGNSVRMYATGVNDGNNWTEVATPFDAQPTIALSNGKAFALSNGKVYASSDARNWNMVSEAPMLKSIVAACRSEIYALTTDGKMVKSTDNGNTWTQDKLDTDASMLPQTGICSICIPSGVNPEIDRVMIIGSRNADDKTATVWTKTIDNNAPEKSQPWMYQPFESYTWHHAPNFITMSAIAYGDGAFLMGSYINDGLTTVSNFGLYYSRDYGMNWWEDKRFTLPQELNCNPASFTMVSDGSKHFWILCGTTGDVWQGHYSTWAWE